MRAIVLYPIICMFLVGTASAKPGFNEAKSAKVPLAVQNAEASILKIVFPYYLTLSQKDAASFLTATHLKEDGRKDIEECLASSAKFCSFRIVQVEGTAFVDRRSVDSLWTNCHLIDGWIRYQKYKALQTGTDFSARLRSEKLWVTLVDSDGQLVAENVPYDLEVVHAINGEGPELSGCTMTDDAIRIKGADLGRPGLKWGRLAEGQATYAGGFPHQTTDRVTIEVGDSDGQQFYWTQGYHLSAQQFNAKLESRGLEANHYNLIVHDIYGVILSNDGAEGMSGGPILNDAGEVIGIFKGLLPDPAKYPVPLATLGISTMGMIYLEARSGY